MLAVKITDETTKLNAKDIMVILPVVTSYSTNLHTQHQCAWEKPSQMIIFGQDHFSYSHFYS